MPTYSEITLAFSDWTNGNELFIETNSSLYGWDWVTTRTSNNQVESGTPTGNVGETTAINFKAAFDLDYPTGYVTTIQNTNEVLIQSETLGETFDSVYYGGDNTNFATVTFNNYVAPPQPTDVDLMLTRSPHYINIPFNYESTTSADIDLYVWFGDINTPPSTPTETINKIRPTIDYSEFNINISNTVRDQLNAKPVFNFFGDTSILNSYIESVKWVKYVASYNDEEKDISDIENTLVSTDGYGYMREGVNPTKPSNSILTNVNFRKVDRSSIILLPFVNDGTITSFNIQSNLVSISETESVTTSDNSDEYVQYLAIDVSATNTLKDDNIVITVNPSGDEYTYQILDECRYTPTTVLFQNKYGVFEPLYMFKKRVEKLNVERKDFKNNYISDGSYDTTKHQKRHTNIVANESMTLNSGFIDEQENELYKQMLMSDNIYFLDSDGLIPVLVTSSSWAEKTRVNDSVINYTIDFEYAFNNINNI